MASSKEVVITIESILGGQSDLRYYSSKDQFLGSHSIDPDQPAADTGTQSYRASGFLRPASAQKIDSATSLVGAPMWMVGNPKNDSVYIYGSTGSIYTLNPSNYAITALAGFDTADSSGNGAEYYDNYLYFFRNLDVARYGPLNGAPAMTTSYWVGTLAKTALVNTVYPSLYTDRQTLPNHVAHRHSDGKLYFADVVGNQGVLHYIATTKTTVEGDTNDGSTHNKLDFPWGYRPTALETYQSDLAVALYEGDNDKQTLQKRAKLTFWDTTSNNYNKIIDVEFPDPIITALKNVNGVLYTFSGQLGSLGTRVCRFVGGYSFEQVAFIEDSQPPFPGAVDHILNKVLFGGLTDDITSVAIPSVWAYGSKTGKFTGIYNVMGCSSSIASTEITSLKVITQDGLDFQIPVIGWSAPSDNGVDRQTTDYGRVNQVWRSQVFRIGKPFKVKKIRIPLVQAVAANMTVIPKIFMDEEATNYTLTTINNTNYPNGDLNIVQRPNGITGKHSFFLELVWSGTELLTVALPIEIRLELTDD